MEGKSEATINSLQLVITTLNYNYNRLQSVFMVWFLEVGQHWLIIGLIKDMKLYCTNYSKRCVFMSSVFAKTQNTQDKDWGHATAQRPSTDGEKCGKYSSQTSVSGDLFQVKVRPKAEVSWGSVLLR